MNGTPEVITVYAPRRIDCCTAPFLAKDLDEKLQAGVSLILDLGQTRFIDPPSADVLIQGILKAKQRRARLSLQRVAPQVKVVLEMAGVLQFFRRK
ncbi:STAS domain-containing protein [Oscillatoria sp. FACHB-1407]|uniref:STAS domain-containing protein n=1 Tax=Oscillatoria sp. FACHB-1407 TaxID=2692847 RepID=UPI001684B1DB|nr:STAS domain-containing protein [Oscillatoria sp. FACHB-1407]MBD2462938.1 STAS domain-containing protein [Oscillatoria sp. FACHB-1407]